MANEAGSFDLVNHSALTSAGVQNFPECWIARQLKAAMAERGATTRRVVEYILNHPHEVIRLSITELAEVTGSSEATIVRLCQSLNHKGYQDFKISLSQCLVTPVKSLNVEIEPDDTPDEFAPKVFNTIIQTLRDTEKVFDAGALASAVQILSTAGRIECIGFGSSGPIAFDAYQKFMKIGLTGSWHVDGHNAAMCCAVLRPGDAVLAISYSGTSEELLYAVQVAKEAGAKVVAITRFGRSPLVKLADVSLFTSSPESSYRGEGAASRVAQLAIIDCLYVGIFLAKRPEVEDVLGRSRRAVTARHL